MIPRELIKTYLDVAYRRKWWIAIPTVIALLAGVYLVKTLPRIYRASTTILVIPQRVPEAFVRTTVTAGIEKRIPSLAVQVLSRNYLEKVVREFGLLPADAGMTEGGESAALDRACNRLKRQVELDYDRSQFSYFRIAVDDQDPKKAAGIANRLARLFIEQNSRLREEQAMGTREWIAGELDAKDTELKSIEAQIAAYEKRYMWELPEREEANLRLLQAARDRIRTYTSDIGLQEERLAFLRARLETRQAAAAEGDNPFSVDPKIQRLAQLEEELTQLRIRYTDENPEVQRKIAEIREFRKNNPGLGSVTETTTEPKEVQDLKSEINRLDSKIETLDRQRQAEEKNVGVITQRINNTPRREQELAVLRRDYSRLQSEYDELRKKNEEARLAENLEASNKGEQFQIQDEASVPTSPYKPQPLQILAMCLMAGLGVGVGIAALLEFLNQAVRSEEEFRAAFPDIPLLVSIPSVGAGWTEGPRKSPKKRRRKRPKSAALLLIGVVAVESLVRAIAGWGCL